MQYKHTTHLQTTNNHTSIYNTLTENTDTDTQRHFTLKDKNQNNQKQNTEHIIPIHNTDTQAIHNRTITSTKFEQKAPAF